MTLPFEQSSAWHQAATLRERIASLHAHSPNTPKVDIHDESIERRFQRWRTQPPFDKDSYFAQRLEMDGTSEDELRLLLGESPDDLYSREPLAPVWLKPWNEAFAETHTNNATQSTPRAHDAGAFLFLVEPLISHELKRFRQDVEALVRHFPEAPFEPQSVVNLFVARMQSQTLAMLSRTMILELNVARLQGHLQGETSEARFQHFVEGLRQKEVMLRLLQEYPVLARQVTLQITHWLNFSREFLNHLCTDWERLKVTFGDGGDLGQLTEVTGGAGDTHRSGRSVLIARFSSGVRVVYKPRSLAVDVHLQEFISWVNQRGDRPSFRTLKIIDRESYGWVEFVAADTCTSSAEVERFYQRQGGYLALLYVLQATDFHFENLIAAGEHPVLIDLESLLHPQPENSQLTASEQLAAEKMNSSVLRVGLLPQRIWFSAEQETGLDLSGLGSSPGQLTPQGVPYWKQAGTDEMHIARKRMEMPQGQNRPSLNGGEINLIDYNDAITSGFASIYKTLLKHRDELLANNGPFASFAADEVRALLRPTKFYGELLHEGRHPDFLRNGLDRERFFDRLWIPVEQQPYLKRVIPAERQDLENGDIPMFTTRPNSCDLWTSSRQKIAGFFKETGYARAQQLVRRMSDADLAQQIWFINASFTSLTTDASTSSWPGYQVTASEVIADSQEFLAAACAVGDRLEQLALEHTDDATWIGLTLMNERTWSLQPMGADLYNGVPGVAIFLAYLGFITGNERYTSLSRKALVTIQRQIERLRDLFPAIGGLSGWGGIIYTLTHLGVLWRQPSLLSEAEELVEHIAKGVDHDEDGDILAGAAGSIATLIGLYHHVRSPRILAVATACGDRLLARAKEMERGIGWPSRIATETPLAGFSHGAAGIAWSLLQLKTLTGEDRFRVAAISGMEYERSLFSSEAGNWRDLRGLDKRISTNGNSGTFTIAWCHGAPGVGLGRLHSLNEVDDSEIRDEINVAIHTTLARGFGQNHSLCHGDLGNLDFLLEAAEILKDGDLQTQVNSHAASMLQSMKQHGWLCGVPLRVETPGLMTGLAGIGYGLLRLADPVRVPSLLILAAPRLERNTIA